MNTKQSLLTNDQKLLIAEMQAAYGIDPNEVIFFSEDAEPFFGYEATCVLANHLTDLRGIDIEPVETGFVDSLSLKCTVTLPDGRTRSAVGVVNVSEVIDGVKMSSQQLYATASARAIRNALRTAGINLLKLHAVQRNGSTAPVEFAGPPRSEYQRLLRQAHALGVEARYIVGDDKSAWYEAIHERYGKDGSNELTEHCLADWVAFLRSQVPAGKPAA